MMDIQSKSINDLSDRFIETRSDRDFQNLFNRLRPGLTKFVNNIVHDIDAADDVVADAFIKMWQKIDGYNPKWAFSTWAYSIARNEAMQYLRKKKTVSLENHIKFIGTTDDVDNMMMFEVGNYDELIFNPEDAEVVFQTEEDATVNTYQTVMEQMEKLPAHYKDIIIDREVNKMQYEEIADKHGLHVNTVKTRIMRAREKIMVMANLGERKPRKKNARARGLVDSVE